MSSPVTTVLFQGQLPNSTESAIVGPIYSHKLPVRVSPDLTQATPIFVPLKVEWDKISGATSYIVYASPTPTQRQFFSTTTDTSITFTSDITLPPDLVWNFWVEVIYSNNYKKFISDEPGFLEKNGAFDANNQLSQTTRDIYMIDEGEEKYEVEEIRRRHKAILEYNGEPFLLYLRRWQGVPCTFCRTPGTGSSGQGVGEPTDISGDLFGSKVEQSDDPNFQGVYDCEFCYGTGIVGGYFPSIPILCRYGETPNRSVRFTKGGINVGDDFNSWTLWFPRVHERDFLVRLRTGERFYAKDNKASVWKGITTRQLFNCALIANTDTIYKVTDQGIDDAVTAGNSYDSAQFDQSIFQ